MRHQEIRLGQRGRSLEDLPELGLRFARLVSVQIDAGEQLTRAHVLGIGGDGPPQPVHLLLLAPLVGLLTSQGGQVAPRQPEAGLELDRFPVGCFRFLLPPEQDIRFSEIELGRRRLWTRADNLLEIPEGGPAVTLAQMSPPPDLLRNHESGLSGQQRRCSPEGVIVASDIQVQIRKTQDEEQLTGADLDRFLEHGDGLIGPAEPIVEGSKHEDRDEVIRLLLQGGPELGDGLLVISLRHQQARQSDPRRDVLGISLQRPAKGGRPLPRLAIRHIQRAEERVESRIPLARSHRFLEERDGLFETILLREGGGLRGGGGQGVRIRLDGGVEILEGRPYVPGGEVELAGREVGGHERRIHRGRFGELFLRPLEVSPLRKHMSVEHVRLRYLGSQALGGASGGERIVQASEEQERASPLQVIFGQVL